MIVGNEQRRHPRLRCFGSAEVYFTVSGVPCEAKIINLSLEGCLAVLETPQVMHKDALVEIVFSVNQLPFRVRGQIKAVRSSTEVGFLFPALSKRARVRLGDLIEELRENRKTNGIELAAVVPQAS